MSGNKAFRRAMQVLQDAMRITSNLPLIIDSTELITPERAQELLQKNRCNRPVNWSRVESYSKIMEAKMWQFHSQGIVLDADGNILTGQNRLWAVVYSGTAIHMRVSRATPREAAVVLDRGQPQSARDLATRRTERKHSPIEASIARGISCLRGQVKPSPEEIAAIIVEKNTVIRSGLQAIRGEKKTRGLIMILAALCELSKSPAEISERAMRADESTRRLEVILAPETAASCWGKGAAFRLAMERAREIVRI